MPVKHRCDSLFSLHVPSVHVRSVNIPFELQFHLPDMATVCHQPGGKPNWSVSDADA